MWRYQDEIGFAYSDQVTCFHPHYVLMDIKLAIQFITPKVLKIFNFLGYSLTRVSVSLGILMYRLSLPGSWILSHL